MKTKKFIVLASLLLVLAMVAACGVTEQPNVDATPTQGTSTPSPDANVADPHEPLGCERDGKVFDAVYAANEYSDGRFKVVITGWSEEPIEFTFTGIHTPDDAYSSDENAALVNSKLYKIYTQDTLLVYDLVSRYIRNKADAEYIQNGLQKLVVTNEKVEVSEIDTNAGFYISECEGDEEKTYFVTPDCSVFSVVNDNGNIVMYKTTGSEFTLEPLVKAYAGSSVESPVLTVPGRSYVDPECEDYQLCVIGQDGTHKHFGLDEISRILHDTQNEDYSPKFYLYHNTMPEGFANGGFYITETFTMLSRDESGNAVKEGVQEASFYIAEDGSAYCIRESKIIILSATQSIQFECLCTYIAEEAYDYSALVEAVGK